MQAGNSYSIKLVAQSWTSENRNPTEPSPHIARLCFQYAQSDDSAIAKAVFIASKSDVSVIFAGRNSEHEAEGFDMPDINLRGSQADMIQAVAAVSEKTVMVLCSGGPLDVSSFVDSVDAIIHANYLGQEGGGAIADVLTGKANPSGKLATSWPDCLENTPSFSNFPATRDPNETLPYLSKRDLELVIVTTQEHPVHDFPLVLVSPIPLSSIAISP
jgi:beta-glucosidase